MLTSGFWILLLSVTATAQISLNWRETVWNDDFTRPTRTHYTLGRNSGFDTLAGNALLTPFVAAQTGRLYLMRERDIEYFDARFDAYFGVRTTQNNLGADGIVFALARETAYPESGGGQLNFNGSNGLGIEFDTYENASENDQGEEHVALIALSTANHVRAAQLPRGTLKNGGWHTMSVSFAAGALRVSIDGVDALVYSQAGFVPYRGCFGFTASSGFSFNEHRVDNVTVSLPTARSENLGIYSACDTVRVDRLVRVRNNHPSGAPLSLTSATLRELDGSGEFTFPVNPLPMVVGSGDSVAIPIRFIGTGAGLRRAVLEINSSIGERILDTLFLDLVLPVAQALPAALDFPGTQVGGANDLAVTIRNTGTVPYVLRAAAISHPAFAFVAAPSLPATVRAGDSLRLLLRFAPTAAGSVSGTLVLTETCGTQIVVPLTGEGKITPWIVQIGQGVFPHRIQTLMLHPGGRGDVEVFLTTQVMDVQARGFDADIRYDASIVRPVGATLLRSVWDAGALLVYTTPSAGLVRVSIRSAAPLQQMGRLFTLEFAAVTSDTGCTALEWDTVVWNPQGPSPGVPPTINLDGRICINPSCRTPNGVRSLVLPDLSIRPNPSNPGTTFFFTLPSDSRVGLAVVDALGRVVAKLIDAEYPAGEHRLYFDAQALASGSYLVVLETNAGSIVRQLLLLR